jgi:hypothetical protein
MPVVDERTKHLAMDPAQLAMLLDGIDLNARRLARWNPLSDKGIDTDRGGDQTSSVGRAADRP